MDVTRLLKGALAGSIATGTMSGVMLLMYYLLPWRDQRFPIPPEHVTKRLAGWRRSQKEQSTWMTWVLHFGIGAGSGALYAPFAHFVRLPSLLRGMVFGLLVWAIGYLGVLPAADILPPATRHSAGRNLMMIVAHLVWGLVLALLMDRLAPDAADETNEKAF
jgi:uncharacterized membrane protein YagU involved in acid resistance